MSRIVNKIIVEDGPNMIWIIHSCYFFPTMEGDICTWMCLYLKGNEVMNILI